MQRRVTVPAMDSVAVNGSKLFVVLASASTSTVNVSAHVDDVDVACAFVGNNAIDVTSRLNVLAEHVNDDVVVASALSALSREDFVALVNRFDDERHRQLFARSQACSDMAVVGKLLDACPTERVLATVTDVHEALTERGKPTNWLELIDHVSSPGALGLLVWRTPVLNAIRDLDPAGQVGAVTVLAEVLTAAHVDGDRVDARTFSAVIEQLDVCDDAFAVLSTSWFTGALSQGCSDKVAAWVGSHLDERSVARAALLWPTFTGTFAELKAACEQLDAGA